MYSRHCSGEIHSPSVLRTYPDLHTHAPVEHVGIHVFWPCLICSLDFNMVAILGHFDWQPSSPHSEKYSFFPHIGDAIRFFFNLYYWWKKK